MPRKRKYRWITDPVEKAAAVHGSYILKISDAKSRDAMANNYKQGLERYAENEEAHVIAVAQLAGYYMGLLDPEVRSKIREAIQKAKAKKDEIIAELIAEGKIKVPAPEKARQLAEKVRAIVEAVAAG